MPELLISGLATNPVLSATATVSFVRVKTCAFAVILRTIKGKHMAKRSDLLIVFIFFNLLGIEFIDVT